MTNKFTRDDLRNQSASIAGKMGQIKMKAMEITHIDQKIKLLYQEMEVKAKEMLPHFPEGLTRYRLTEKIMVTLPEGNTEYLLPGEYVFMSNTLISVKDKNDVGVNISVLPPQQQAQIATYLDIIMH